MEAQTRHNRTARPVEDYTGQVSRTKQSFAKEANINSIMKKARKTGVLVDPAAINTARRAFYGDFSSGVTFLDVQNRIAAVKAQFEALPSDIRRALGNDPGELLAVISDPARADEAARLGLIAEDGQMGAGGPPSDSPSGGDGGLPLSEAPPA